MSLNVFHWQMLNIKYLSTQVVGASSGVGCVHQRPGDLIRVTLRCKSSHNDWVEIPVHTISGQ
jgi:hypothetical protein